jgi:hypothetical protein
MRACPRVIDGDARVDILMVNLGESGPAAWHVFASL